MTAPLSAHLSVLSLLRGMDVNDVHSVTAYLSDGRACVRINVHNEPAAERGAVALGLSRRTYDPYTDAMDVQWRLHRWVGPLGNASVEMTWCERVTA